MTQPPNRKAFPDFQLSMGTVVLFVTCSNRLWTLNNRLCPQTTAIPSLVMPAPVAGIHLFSRSNQKDVHDRDKPGHDD